MTSDPSAELRRLRQRAYGPDADMQADPEAASRLDELEDGVRVRFVGRADVVDVWVRPPTTP